MSSTPTSNTLNYLKSHRKFRLNQVRGQLKTETLQHLNSWEQADVDADFIRGLTVPNKLQAMGSIHASQVQALAICFWSQKHKHPLADICHDPEMVARMAKKIYLFQVSCNKLDNKLFKKIGLRWHDLFPTWVPSKAALVKLTTLASGIAGTSSRSEASTELKELVGRIPQSQEPAARVFETVLKSWEVRQKSGASKPKVGNETEAAAAEEEVEEGAGEEEEEEMDLEMEGVSLPSTPEGGASAAEGPMLFGDLPIRSAPRS